MLSRKIFTSVLLFSVYRCISQLIEAKEKTTTLKCRLQAMTGRTNDQRCSQTCVYILSYFTISLFLPEVTPCAVRRWSVGLCHRTTCNHLEFLFKTS